MLLYTRIVHVLANSATFQWICFQIDISIQLKWVNEQKKWVTRLVNCNKEFEFSQNSHHILFGTFAIPDIYIIAFLITIKISQMS